MEVINQSRIKVKVSVNLILSWTLCYGLGNFIEKNYLVKVVPNQKKKGNLQSLESLSETCRKNHFLSIIFFQLKTKKKMF